jgi:hypothetical protein
VYVLCVCLMDRCLSFCPFSFGLCVVSPCSIYRLWLSLWYLQTLLVNTACEQTCNEGINEIYICDNTFNDSCLFENDTSFDFQNFGSNSKLLNIFAEYSETKVESINIIVNGQFQMYQIQISKTNCYNLIWCGYCNLIGWYAWSNIGYTW